MAFPEHSLRAELSAYLSKGYYPLHMPGHKRRLKDASLPYAWDLTEVLGTDNLHAASGILRDAMERTAALYGADQTWYLINGSSCGNLAALFACCPPGGEAVIARNCHHSVLHAVRLRCLRVHWLLPSYDAAFGIYGSVEPAEVERMLIAHPESRAVVLTSPTYEGVVSDIRSIAAVCHRYNVPLIVDEAHGAHFGLSPKWERSGGMLPPFPPSAIQLGADLVVQSPHKTLCSLTQSAWLHWKKGYVDETRVGEMLTIFESSSPSYPLLLSLDACTALLRERGKELFSAWQARLERFYGRCAAPSGGLRHFTLLNPSATGQSHPFYTFDYGKLLFSCRGSCDGRRLASALQSRFSFVLEMYSPWTCLAMTSPFDEEDALDRFLDALRALEKALEEESPEEGKSDKDRSDEEGQEGQGMPAFFVLPKVMQCLPEAVCTVGEAAEREHRLVSLRDAEGQVMGEYVECYPPGIPLLVPGERVSAAWIEALLHLQRAGAVLSFSGRRRREDAGKSTLEVLA